MKRAVLMSIVLSLALLGCGIRARAATLTVKGTAPASVNGGSCTAPELTPAAGAVVMHFAWTGPVAGEDSIATTAGTLVSLTRKVPAGTYAVRGWASNAWGAGCDTTVTRVVGDPPAKPVIQ